VRATSLTLSLFMSWILANNANYALAANHTTLVTHFLDRCTDFHACTSSTLPIAGMMFTEGITTNQ